MIESVRAQRARSRGTISALAGATVLQLLVAVVVALVLVTWASPATAAEPAPAPLTGEQLLALEVLGFPGVFDATELDCAPALAPNTQETGRDSSFNFHVEGIATGPYPGTFTADGSVVIGPITNQGTRSPDGPVTTFTERFVIYSGDATVRGTKTLRITSPPEPVFRAPADLTNRGDCYNFRTEDGRGTDVASFRVTTSYEATITTPDGQFRDSGTNDVEAQEIFYLPQNVRASGNFVQDFLSSQTTTVPVIGPPATVSLDPVFAINPVGTTHTVTATVLDAAGQPVPNVTVRFRVAGASSATGSCTTDADGQCSFTYQGPNLPGADVITAYADADKDNTQDVGEPAGEATKVFVLPASTPGQVTGGGQVDSTVGAGDVAFGFNARSTDRGLQGNCTVVDTSGSNTKVKCLTVESLVQTATHATFFGRAEVNGVVTDYRIDVDDLAEPGRGRDTFKIITGAGYSAAGVLTAGNIQIHE